MGKLTVQHIIQWAQIGETYNEDYGVDTVHIKKINGKWAYVQVEWRFRIPDVGFIFYDGRQLEKLSDLPISIKPLSNKKEK